MAFAFVAATTAVSSGTVNSLAAAWPSAVSGDVVLCCLAIGGLSTLVDPTGFTATSTVDSSTTLRTKVWQHVCDGTESGSVTASWTGTAQQGSLVFVAYRGVNVTTPVDITGNNANSTPTTAPNINQTGANTVSDLQICPIASVNATAVNTTTITATQMVKRADASSTVTPFIGLAVLEGLGVQGAATTGLTSRAPTFSQSSSYAYYNIGLRELVSTQSDVASGGSYVTESATLATTFSDLVSGSTYVGDIAALVSVSDMVFAAPVTGQLWPRGNKS